MWNIGTCHESEAKRHLIPPEIVLSLSIWSSTLADAHMMESHIRMNGSVDMRSGSHAVTLGQDFDWTAF